MEHVDPPDLGLRPTLLRLVPLWWEQRRLAGFGLLCALAFTALSMVPALAFFVLAERRIVGGLSGAVKG